MDRRKITSKLNGLKSKGPVTKNGKDWSSKNAIKHGLNTSNHVLTIGENVGEFNKLVKQASAYYQPFDFYSETLFERIVEIIWKLKRISRIESGIYAFEIQAHEADEYKAKIKDEVHHSDFHEDDKTKVNSQNLLYGIAYVKDANSGNALIKLSTHETKLLNKLHNLQKIYKEHKEDRYGLFKNKQLKEK